MFVIKKDEAVLAYLERPTWIKRLSNGCFGLTDRAHATGIAMPDGPVSLGSSDSMSGLPVAHVSEVDGGELLAQYAADIDYLSAMTGVDFPSDEGSNEPEEAEET